jgi:hypothetical protein
VGAHTASNPRSLPGGTNKIPWDKADRSGEEPKHPVDFAVRYQERGAETAKAQAVVGLCSGDLQVSIWILREKVGRLKGLTV